MKNQALTLLFILFTCAIQAQIKVASNSNVAIGYSTTPPNQKLDVLGDAYIRCLPSPSGIYFENYNGNPIIKGQWGNSVWLGNLASPLWRVYANRIYSTSASNFTYSDARLKTNVKPITNSLQNIMKLNPVKYDLAMPSNQDIPEDKRTHISESGKNQMGLIAQELATVFPEAVDYDKENDLYAVSYGTLIPILIKAIQEQQNQIEELQRRLSK